MGLIKRLKNPRTDLYKDIKRTIFSIHFPWFNVGKILETYSEEDTKKYALPSMWSHAVLVRPHSKRSKYPTVNSTYMAGIEKMLDEIFEYNNINVKCIYRINVNLVEPQKGKQLTPPHSDHPWPHNNLIIYLSDAGGETICEGESFNPREDDIIIFSGYPQKHCYKLPKEDKRIIIVVTYL